MSEEQELKPLVLGAVSTESRGRERLNFPVGQMIQVHVLDGKYGDFDKEIEDRETGEKKIIKQKKVILTFVVDSEVSDQTTKEPLKGKSFTKSLTVSEHERATYPSFITAVNGTFHKDPAVALGKPLQVLFQPWSKFGEFEYQPITYLPPVAGQKAPKKDVVPTAEDIGATDIDEAFAQALGGK